MSVSNKFLNLCNECNAFCCRQRLPPISTNEKKRILDAGYENNFLHLKDDIYTIIPSNKGCCPYLKSDNSCKIQDVKPTFCRIWPIVPRIRNDKRAYLIIKCPIFCLLSKEDIEKSKKEAEKIPEETIIQLWDISDDLKEKYKKFEYRII